MICGGTMMRNLQRCVRLEVRRQIAISSRMSHNIQAVTSSSPLLRFVRGLSATSQSSAVETEDSSRYESIKVTFEAGVRTIIMNRPDKKNALNEKMFAEIPLALDEAARDPQTVITATTGAGNVYCAGNDKDNFRTITMNQVAQLLTSYFAAYVDFPKPLIALVNGAAVGGGCTVMPLHDIVYASEKAVFFTPFSALNITAEGCSSFTFPRLMGQAKASEMLYFNKKVGAREAEKLRLVTEVLPSETFMEAARVKLLAMATLPLKSLVYSKQLSRDPFRATLHKVNAEECKRVTERFVKAFDLGQADYEEFVKQHWG